MEPYIDGIIYEDENGAEIAKLEKHCLDCGKLIAVLTVYSTPHERARYNPLKRCPECARARTEAKKLNWQRENRHTCRTTNKALKRELSASRRQCAALEESVRLLEQKNERLRIGAGRPVWDDAREREQKGGFFGALAGVFGV